MAVYVANTFSLANNKDNQIKRLVGDTKDANNLKKCFVR